MKSMTGFGRAKLETENRIYTIEMKSVNHKYSDISIKLPRSLSYLEEKIKKQISGKIARGKIDVLITFENYGEEGKEIVINHEIVKQYMKEFLNLVRENDLRMENIPITEMTKLPEVLTIKTKELAEDIVEQEVMTCLNEAIQNFVSMREQEGNRIKEDLQERARRIEEQITKISAYSAGLVEEYVVKLEQRVKTILQTDTIEEARIAQEAVIYADKISIEEELTRLSSHVGQLQNLLEEQKPIGKKIDFLLQEMNRETNTIGSKSGSLEITNLVVEVKTELEDIREQIQNIE